MTDQHDPFWSAVLAADTPSAEELARAEADLREFEPGPSLPQERIDAMVRAAVMSTGGGMVAPRRSKHRRLAAVAAVALLSLSLAWIVIDILWREGTHATRTLDYALAIRVAAEPNQPEADRLAALGRIKDHCDYAFLAIRDLCADDVALPLRDRARRIRDELATLLSRGADRVPEAADLRLLEVRATALDASLTIEQRQRALVHLGNLCIQGIRAFEIAELPSPESNAKRDAWRQGLLRSLAR